MNKSLPYDERNCFSTELNDDLRYSCIPNINITHILEQLQHYQL